MPALHRAWTFVGCGKHTLITKDLLTNMRCLISTVCNYSFYFRKTLCYLVIYFVKCNAVMDITGSDYDIQHKTILVASGMGFISKLAFVVSLYEKTTFRVRDTLRYCTILFFLAASLLLLGGVVFALLG